MDGMYPMPINTGNARRDLNLTALRYSGSAWWLVLGLMALEEAVIYANSTQAAYLLKKPIKAATGAAMASSGQFLLKHTWVLGPAVLSVARLLKRRDTDGCESKLDHKGRREIHDIGNQIQAGVTETGQPIVDVKASQLLALAELIKAELKNTNFPESHGDSLSPEAINKLFGDSDLDCKINFSVMMDIETGLGSETLASKGDPPTFQGSLSEMLRAGEIEKAVDYGISMIQYGENGERSYDIQADPADYIKSLPKNDVETSLEKADSEATEPHTDSFLVILDRVRGVTEDAELMAEVMRNPEVLFAIERGFIRDELRLKTMLKGGSHSAIKKIGRGL